MGSVTPLRVPSIHFSDETVNSGSIREDVWRALVEFGCFEAVYDKIPLELHSALFGLVKDFYDLPVERKFQYKCSTPFSGYVGKRPRSPLSELLGIEDSTNVESLEDFTNQVWPEGKPKSSELIHSYVTKVAELEKMVKKMVMEFLGVEKYFESYDASISYSLRLMKYERPMTDEITLGVGAHTDKSFVTVLQQNQVDGLEVQTKEGEWVRVSPAPNSFVVMAGDPFHNSSGPSVSANWLQRQRLPGDAFVANRALTPDALIGLAVNLAKRILIDKHALLAWTNGRVHAPNHRVMVRGYEARYSMGLFSFAKEGNLVQCPKELIDEEHPQLFKPFDHQGLVRFFTSEAGIKAEATQSTLKAYCGVYVV